MASQNLTSFSDKVYVSGQGYRPQESIPSFRYDFDNNTPGFVVEDTHGSITDYYYDKDKVYLYFREQTHAFYGNPPQFPWDGETEQGFSVNISYWSNAKDEWVTVSLYTYEKSLSHETEVETSDCAPYYYSCSYSYDPGEAL